MRLNVSNGIRSQFPELRLGCVIARGIDNRGCEQDIEQLRANTVRSVRARFTSKSIPEDPRIAIWHSIYRGFGCSPRKHRPTVESLLRRAITGGDLPRVNKAVDLYLIAECESLLPVGGYDTEKLVGDISLRYSPGGEVFTPIGSETTQETLPGEIVYADDLGVLTRRWNYKDSARACISKESRSVVLFTEAPCGDAIPDNEIEVFVDRLAELLSAHCGGSVSTQILTLDASQSHEIECVEV